MDYKRIFVSIDALGVEEETLVSMASMFEDYGSDGLFLSCLSFDEKEREDFLEKVKRVTRTVDIPVIISCRIKRFEDIKKAFYTGAKDVAIEDGDLLGNDLLKEGTDRFGAEHVYRTGDLCFAKEVTPLDICKLFESNELVIIPFERIGNEQGSILKLKNSLKNLKVNVNTFESSISFSELKTDANGLIPCIVQDYRTSEVLMMAYMDEEAFQKTIDTGIMTYHSRSRNELWVKGLTSGNYQYIKSLSADCDKDTLLAKVHAIGPACHTGAGSCFFNSMLLHDYEEKDVYKVLKKLYDVVVDRKQNPKEGSYTNYLFDKGIDKILKKCGEEATEMVIAAKNPNAEELKYEIADLMYHMTVLMVECGVDWEDVAAELANR